MQALGNVSCTLTEKQTKGHYYIKLQIGAETVTCH